MSAIHKIVDFLLGESQSCECRDPGCPACHGKCSASAKCNLRRVDMADETGTFFCDKCAADALEAGVFSGPHTGNFIKYHGRTPRAATPVKADLGFTGAGSGYGIGDDLSGRSGGG